MPFFGARKTARFRAFVCLLLKVCTINVHNAPFVIHIGANYHKGTRMQFLVRFFPEITIKSRPVRKRFIKVLRRNLRTLLSRLDEKVQLVGDWDVLEITTELAGDHVASQFMDILTNTPGVSVVMKVQKEPLTDFDDMVQALLPWYEKQLPGRTFAVRCKRQGRHGFKSVDVERHIGAALIRLCHPAGVNLDNPDVTVRLEIRHNDVYVVQDFRRGLGGYPLGTQDAVLSLISGGFDSAVSSYRCIKRGLLTHYLFFNLGGKAHELAVKELAVYLWMRFGASQRVKFISVPFEGVVEEILTRVDNSQMGVVLKRMMMRAADRVAEDLQIQALVTGESVAQVSSQTLPNLALIDRVTDRLVLRPLITSDKQEIIDIAREIGTEEFSKNVPEYCGVISVKPTTRARLERIEAEESRMDMTVLDDALAGMEVQIIDRVVEGLGHFAVEPDEYTNVPERAVVIDIRHPDEQDRSPLRLSEADSASDIIHMPFYQLRSQFTSLDPERQYLLYCDKGIMSRLHASHLKDAGHNNVAVYRP